MVEQEPRKTYSESDIEKEVEKRMAAVQLEQLSDRMSRHEAKSSEIFSEIRSSLKSLNDSASTSMTQLYQCRQDLRDEIEKEFVTKTVFELEMKRVESLIQGQWKTITMAVSVAVIAIQLSFQIFGK